MDIERNFEVIDGQSLHDDELEARFESHPARTTKAPRHLLSLPNVESIRESESLAEVAQQLLPIGEEIMVWRDQAVKARVNKGIFGLARGKPRTDSTEQLKSQLRDKEARIASHIKLKGADNLDFFLQDAGAWILRYDMAAEHTKTRIKQGEYKFVINGDKVLQREPGKQDKRMTIEDATQLLLYARIYHGLVARRVYGIR